MTSQLKRNLSQVLHHQADILQPILAQFSHIKINHLNYHYADWQHQTLTFLGTEADWLQHCVDQRLFLELHPRLTPLINLWEAGSSWYKAYQHYRHQQQLRSDFLKTDICLEGQHGLHLMEIEHDRPLTLYDVNPLFECIGQLKDESIRLQKQHPDLIIQLNKPIEAPKPPELENATFIDLNLIEEADPIPLNEDEINVIQLRLQGYSDDEIADHLQARLSDVRQLFTNVANKHHHPYIPNSVYQQHLPQAMKRFSTNTHTV